MTFRALIIGLASAMFIAGAGYINDRVLELESFNNGHQIPIIVMGLMFVGVLVLNPLLFRIRRSLAFRPAEIGLIVVLAMASCGISGRGLMEQYLQALVMPFHWNKIEPGWQSRDMLGYVPEQCLVDPEPEDDVVSRFVTGSDKLKNPPDSVFARIRIKAGRVPWRQWSGPMKTWLPLILLSGVAMVAMAMIVHRQWSSYEHLQYPIAQFTGALLEREPTRAFSSIFSNRMFWIGFLIVFGIRLNNGLYRWFPEYLVDVRLDFSLWPIFARWPALQLDPWAWGLMSLNIFPLVIAFAFFLSSEIALTLGLSQILWAAFAIPIVSAGISLSTDYDIGGWQGWHRAGSYTAFTLMLLYAGRHYYGTMLKHAIMFWRKPPDGDDSTAVVWWVRALIVSVTAMTILVIRIGLSWPIAVATVVLMLMTFLIVSRVSAETGLFFIQPGWQPFGALIPLFGPYAMGGTGIVLSALVCGILCIDQSQAIMPYLINGLKISEKVKLKVPRVAETTLAMYVAGVALAIVVVLIASYDFGTPANYGWSYHRIPTIPFRAAEPKILHLEAQGLLAESEALTGFQRIANIRPEKPFLWAAGTGFLLVILFSVLRLRVKWWPLHPCLFLIWATYPLCAMFEGFLIGWYIKRVALRCGGNRLVQQLKPMAVGVIAAEIFGALVFMAVGAIYYFVMDKKPIGYLYFPR